MFFGICSVCRIPFFFFQGRNFVFPFIPFSSFLFLSLRGDSNLLNFFIRIH